MSPLETPVVRRHVCPVVPVQIHIPSPGAFNVPGRGSILGGRQVTGRVSGVTLNFTDRGRVLENWKTVDKNGTKRR